MQSHLFSDSEGIRIAAEMERRGGDFYRRAARIARSEEMRAFLEELALDEETHKAEFARLLERTHPSTETYDAETNAFLSAVAADIVFPNGLLGLNCGCPNALNSPRHILEYSIKSEQDSIAFYTRMTQVAGESARPAFADIIRQEKMHMARLQRLLSELEEDKP